MARYAYMRNTSGRSFLDTQLSASDVASYCDVSRKTVYRDLNDGVCVGHRIGLIWRIKKSDANAYKALILKTKSAKPIEISWKDVL